MNTGDLRALLTALTSLPERRRREVRIPLAVATAVMSVKEDVLSSNRPVNVSLAGCSGAPQLTKWQPTSDVVPDSFPTDYPKPPPHNPPKPAPNRAERLYSLRQRVLTCTTCPHLVATRNNVVFGVGNPEAELMFVGEAPGADEDIQGEPFVGAAGKLLTKIIEAMALNREKVYIANVLKCRPDMPPGSSGNRPPRRDEMASCLPHLLEQIRIIAPKCIVALGSTAVCGLFGLSEIKMSVARGKWKLLDLDIGDQGSVPVMVTYHPAYLLRNQTLSEKRKVWDDMLAVLNHLGHPITERQRSFFLSPGR